MTDKDNSSEGSKDASCKAGYDVKKIETFIENHSLSDDPEEDVSLKENLLLQINTLNTFKHLAINSQNPNNSGASSVNTSTQNQLKNDGSQEVRIKTGDGHALRRSIKRFRKRRRLYSQDNDDTSSDFEEKSRIQKRRKLKITDLKYLKISDSDTSQEINKSKPSAKLKRRFARRQRNKRSLRPQNGERSTKSDSEASLIINKRKRRNSGFSPVDSKKIRYESDSSQEDLIKSPLLRKNVHICTPRPQNNDETVSSDSEEESSIRIRTKLNQIYFTKPVKLHSSNCSQEDRIGTHSERMDNISTKRMYAKKCPIKFVNIASTSSQTDVELSFRTTLNRGASQYFTHRGNEEEHLVGSQNEYEFDDQDFSIEDMEVRSILYKKSADKNRFKSWKKAFEEDFLRLKQDDQNEEDEQKEQVEIDNKDEFVGFDYEKDDLKAFSE